MASPRIGTLSRFGSLALREEQRVQVYNFPENYWLMEKIRMREEQPLDILEICNQELSLDSSGCLNPIFDCFVSKIRECIQEEDTFFDVHGKNEGRFFGYLDLEEMYSRAKTNLNISNARSHEFYKFAKEISFLGVLPFVIENDNQALIQKYLREVFLEVFFDVADLNLLNSCYSQVENLGTHLDTFPILEKFIPGFNFLTLHI